MKAFIGIDPGKSGGVAIIRDDGVIVVEPYSDEGYIKMMKACSQCESVRVCIEHVSAMPKQGVVGVFTFGKEAGFLEGVLQALGISYQLIRPQTWKKEFGLSSDKQASIDVCRRLFPSVNLLATERCRKPHDGMAEALLMAEYARRKL